MGFSIVIPCPIQVSSNSITKSPSFITKNNEQEIYLEEYNIMIIIIRSILKQISIRETASFVML
jgi:hypothetical protein